jgi:hypothetical protein
MPSSSDGRDNGLIARLEALHVSVVSDCLDRVGLRDNVMAPHIRPPIRGWRTAGFAATVSVVAVDAPPADRAEWTPARSARSTPSGPAT